MVYLAHQAGARRRRCQLKRAQTSAQTEKLRPVAGGMKLRLPHTTGRLIHRQTLLAGRRRPMSQIMSGAKRPRGKAQMRGR